MSLIFLTDIAPNFFGRCKILVFNQVKVDLSPEGVGAGVGKLLVGDEEEGYRGASRQEEDKGDDDLLGQRGTGIVAVLCLSSGLQVIRIVN